MMGTRQPGWRPYLAHLQPPHLRHSRCLAWADNFEFGEPPTNQAYWPLGRGQVLPLRAEGNTAETDRNGIMSVQMEVENGKDSLNI
jgi:hypothetical protein